MSAIPVGYNSIQGLHRKGVSLLCILLASAMAMGILVYVDSFSIHEWDNQVGSIGSVAMSADGPGIESYVDEIRAIPNVERAQPIQYSSGMIFYRSNEIEMDQYYGRFDSPSAGYFDSFPDAYALIEGRYPLNESEIALSRSAIERMGYNIGDIVNYSYNVWNEYGSYRSIESYLLGVVGIFEKESNTPDDWYWYYDSSIGIVVPELLNSLEIDISVHIEIDRTPLTPFDTTISLGYLLNIEQSIRELDPTYDPVRGYGRFYVDDNLAEGISRYATWQANMRNTQLGRASAVLMLVGLVMFLAIRYNVNERRFENNMLMSRGAAKSDIDRRMLKEIMGIASIGAIVGLGIGVLFSRFGLASVGFFEFNWALFFTEPLLISLFSIIISVLIGIILPYATWLVYQAIYSTRKRVEEHEGKLQKLSRVLVFIRWDVVLLALSVLLLIGLTSAGPLVLYNPFFTMILGYIPLAIFISLGSLCIKALRSGANPISRGMSHLIGILPSMIGVRRIGKSASSAGPAILVLVLSMSIAWTYAIIGASMPITKENQGRLAFGGDVAFRLGSYPTPAWNNFTANVTSHELTAAATMVSSTQLQLSAGYYDWASVLAINPEEYRYVGYDYMGIQLNGSNLAPMLTALASNPSGAIITRDIANQYAFETGDSLRGFSFDYQGVEETFTFTIVGITDALVNGELHDTGTPTGDVFYGYYQEVGANTIWVNREYLGTLISLDNSTENILCVRTNKGANGTQLVADVLDAGGSIVISDRDWSAVSYEVDNYLSQTAYRMDRAVDTMLTISTAAIIFGSFIIYAFEGLSARKREIALIRSMGGDRSVVVKSQMAEMLVLLGVGIILLLGYGPLHITNSLVNYRSSLYLFPVSVFPVIPWFTLLSVFLFFVGSIAIFIVVVAILGTRVNIAEALNANWAESGPYGGDV